MNERWPAANLAKLPAKLCNARPVRSGRVEEAGGERVAPASAAAPTRTPDKHPRAGN